MKKLQVLIISYSYPPANVPAAQRPYSIAKYLDKDKFNVTVLTCGNQDSSLGFNKDFNEKLQKVNLIKIDGYKVKATRSIVANNRNNNTKKTKGIKSVVINFLSYFIIPDKAIFWYPKVLKFLNKNKLKFDIVFSTSPAMTNHLIALKLKKRNPKTIYISDFRDFHYLNIFQNKNGLKAYINKKLELKIMKTSDKVTFISDSMLYEYKNYYPKFKDKFRTIYNGFDIDEYDLAPSKDINKEKLSIFYAGSFYKGVRDPLPLLMILEKIINENFISTSEIVIKIAGNFEATLLDKIKSLNIYDSIIFLGQIPRSEVLTEYKKSHLLWLIIGSKKSHYTGVPIKFYEYLASQRPIINFAPNVSEPTKIINKLKLGWNIDINELSIEEQITIFKEIIASFKANNLYHKIDLKSITKFSRKNQTKTLEKLFLKNDNFI